MSKIIILNGHPATGKSYFLQKVEETIELPVISKDIIKEKIGDSLTNINLQLSQELGKASFDLIHYFILQMLKVGGNFVVEAPLKPKFENEFFNDIYSKFRPDVFQIIFKAKPKTIEQRIKVRTNLRHQIHMDTERTISITHEHVEEFGFLDIPSTKVTIDTEALNTDIELKKTLETIQKFLKN